MQMKSAAKTSSAAIRRWHRLPVNVAGCICTAACPFSNRSFDKSTDTPVPCSSSSSKRSSSAAGLHPSRARRLSPTPTAPIPTPPSNLRMAATKAASTASFGSLPTAPVIRHTSTTRVLEPAFSSPTRTSPQGRRNKRGLWGLSSPTQSAIAPDLSSRPRVERGIVSPRLPVPDDIPKTPYFLSGKVENADHVVALHTPETLAPMREACVLARQVLDLCCSLAEPGVTTDAIDAAAHAAIVKAGACPSPLNYHGFPKSVCSSVNEIACHAIPDDRPLAEGDLVSFDVSVFYKGFHGDNCATVGVGAIDADGQRLIDATKEAMMTGVAACRPGGCLTEIGSAIHDVADRHGFDTVTRYCGHGVGSAFHMFPYVQHFRNNLQVELIPGMTFTVEPIFTEGKQATGVWSDGWTVYTKDGGRAAQFEHVVLITEDGHEILTVPTLGSTSP